MSLFLNLIHMVSLGFYLMLINMHRSKVKSLFGIVDLQEISCMSISFHISTNINWKSFSNFHS